VAPTHLRAHVRHPHAVEQEVALPAHVLHGVGSKGLKLNCQPLLGCLHRRLDDLGGLDGALGNGLLGAGEYHSASGGRVLSQVDDHPLTLTQTHDVRAQVINEGNTGLQQDARTEIRIASGDRGRGIEDRGGLTLDERLGGYAVQVTVVDDGDVARAQALGERLGPGVHAHEAAGALRLRR